MKGAELREGVWTVPNVIGVLRILGAGPLLWAAHQGHRHLFLAILVLILLSDWVDGKLAHVLDQRTELGARLDSAADAVMYAAVAVAFWWMEGEAVRERIGWFLAIPVPRRCPGWWRGPRPWAGSWPEPPRPSPGRSVWWSSPTSRLR